MSQKNKSHLLNKLWCNAHLLLILAALFWAGHAIVLRMSVGEISPILLMELRWLCSFLILATIFRGKILSYLDQAVKNWRWIMIMGGVGLAGFTILLVYAAQYTTAMNLGIMQAAMPAFVLIFGFLFFSNSINARQCLGFLYLLLGCGVN